MTSLAEASAFHAEASQGAACQLMSRDLYRLAKALPLDRSPPARQLLSLCDLGLGQYMFLTQFSTLVTITDARLSENLSVIVIFRPRPLERLGREKALVRYELTLFTCGR